MNEYICIYDEDEMAYIPNPYEEKTWLVRCKDCKYYFKDAKPYPICYLTECNEGKNDFCSSGERKEE